MGLLKRFLKGEGGNVAIIFGLAIIPMMMGVGAAIDMVNANRVATVLQGAADAAALAGAISSETDPAKLKQIATDYLVSNGVRDAVEVVTKIDASKDSTSGDFTVYVAGNVPTVFMRIAGVPGLEIGATAVANRGNNAIEIALALDNTGSMSWNGKLAALKTSAKNMIDTLYDKSPSGSDIRIGLVPFSEYVNVGVANRGQPWLDVADDSSPQYCVDTYPNQTNCRPEMWDDPDDDTPDLVPREVCDPGLPVQVCKTKDLVWQGCVGSRSNPLDEFDSSALIFQYPGLFDVRCPSALQTLTTDRLAMKAKIDGMVAVGNTYIPAGLIWGWNVLSARKPFAQGRNAAALKAANGKKALVLMTDGVNTLIPAYPFHTPNSNVAVSNAKAAALCDNIKTEGIIVYTIAFQVTDVTVKAMLENCATAPENYFDASNNALLGQAFETIALSLATPRLTR